MWNDRIDHSTDFVATIPQLLKFTDEWNVVHSQEPAYILLYLDSKDELHIVAYDREEDLPYLLIRVP